jgi:hypothetical protein
MHSSVSMLGKSQIIILWSLKTPGGYPPLPSFFLPAILTPSPLRLQNYVTHVYVFTQFAKFAQFLQFPQFNQCAQIPKFP